ncbi:transmembrane protein 154 isoform X1 [Cottoperca gobio]|uniref:Transmembrane protein 154 isoform X1 n=1 Tax=Cottoperca gobio TaxID=56716 RepID=A0A6J2PSD4_COTGO|nr:transmembrane protein 154 isoform X1 [Cottoperca gobio]
MFASGTGSMRGPRAKTPLLLLLLLLTALTGTVLCEDEDDGGDAESQIVDGDETDVDPEPDVGGDEITETVPTETEATSAPEPFTSVDDTETINNEDYGGSGRTLPFDDSTEDPIVTGSTDSPDGEELMDPSVIMIPVLLVFLIISMIVCGIFINRRWRKKALNQELRKEDPYLDGSSTEKVPMPMFEEDVPSVLELEMEELDNWMKNDCEAAEDSIHP